MVASPFAEPVAFEGSERSRFMGVFEQTVFTVSDGRSRCARSKNTRASSSVDEVLSFLFSALVLLSPYVPSHLFHPVCFFEFGGGCLFNIQR